MFWLHGFTEWHNKHIREISWFFIGLFFVSLITDIRRGDTLWVVIDTLIIFLNYWTWSKETKKS